jgi:predicted dehydrogenase
VRVALVGAGNIAGRYAEDVVAAPQLDLAGATDVLPGRAAELVARHGGTAYGSLAELLADDRVDIVVNLTAPTSHAAVTAAALDAGKHVHTEKPVARRHAEARELAALADRRGVRLSCAPATLLGEAQQTAWKLVRDGALGEVRVCYAEANWGRIESWHPSPETLYEAGPVVDVGIYPLTILTGMFGPVRTVRAYGATIQPERVRRDGGVFRLSTPDFTVAALELESGVVVRLTATFWVGPGKQRGIEFHGHESSLYLASWAEFDSRLEHSIDGESYTAVPLVREPYRGIDWSRALVELVDAVARGRPHRAGAEHAAHVVEVLEAIAAAASTGGAVAVASSFPAPHPPQRGGGGGRE